MFDKLSSNLLRSLVVTLRLKIAFRNFHRTATSILSYLPPRFFQLFPRKGSYGFHGPRPSVSRQTVTDVPLEKGRGGGGWIDRRTFWRIDVPLQSMIRFILPTKISLFSVLSSQVTFHSQLFVYIWEILELK